MPATTKDRYRRATRYLDSDHPRIRQFAADSVAPDAGERDRAVALYYRVRDAIWYDPYLCSPDPDTVTASRILAAGTGYCVGKAVLLAAVGRAAGLATRLGFADVKNHLSSPRLRAMMQTDVFYYHGFAEFFLDGRWIKATPAFNLSLCAKAGVKPLEWDGTEDSVFHAFDAAGARHMEYLNVHEPAADLPLDALFAAYRRYYPAMFGAQRPAGGDFAAEVGASGA